MGKTKRSIDDNPSGDVAFGLMTDLDRLPQWSTVRVETHGTPRQPVEKGDVFVQTSVYSARRSRRSGASPKRHGLARSASRRLSPAGAGWG